VDFVFKLFSGDQGLCNALAPSSLTVDLTSTCASIYPTPLNREEWEATPIATNQYVPSLNHYDEALWVPRPN